MTIDFYLAQGDQLTSLEKTLTDASGAEVELDASVDTVKFSVKNDSGTTVIFEADALWNIGSADVRYDWTEDDIEALIPGYYEARFVVVYLDGKRFSFPNSSYILMQVGESIQEPEV